ncbi:MAG: hypothetical protein HLUCCA11_21700, partial [Phormidesmis priestleyi Ana]
MIITMVGLASPRMDAGFSILAQLVAE